MSKRIRAGGNTIDIHLPGEDPDATTQRIVNVVTRGFEEVAAICGFLSARVAEIEAKVGLSSVSANAPDQAAASERLAALDSEFERIRKAMLENLFDAMREGAREPLP